MKYLERGLGLGDRVLQKLSVYKFFDTSSCSMRKKTRAVGGEIMPEIVATYVIAIHMPVTYWHLSRQHFCSGDNAYLPRSRFSQSFYGTISDSCLCVWPNLAWISNFIHPLIQPPPKNMTYEILVISYKVYTIKLILD